MSVKASPAGNSLFSAWDISGPCSGKGESCSVIMNDNKSVTANFSCSGGIGVKCDPDRDGTTGGGGPGGGGGVNPPNTPSLSLNNASCGKITLSWNDVSNETGYNIKRKIDDGSTPPPDFAVAVGNHYLP